MNERIAKFEKNKVVPTVDLEYIELVQMFMLQNELYDLLHQYYPNAWLAQDQEKHNPFKFYNQRLNTYSNLAEHSSLLGKSMDMLTMPYQLPYKPVTNYPLLWRIAERWLYELNLTIDHLRLCIVQSSIDRSESKYRKEKGKRQQAINQMIASNNSGG